MWRLAQRAKRLAKPATANIRLSAPQEVYFGNLHRQFARAFRITKELEPLQMENLSNPSTNYVTKMRNVQYAIRNTQYARIGE
jgi:hypothetical protein